MKHLQSLIKLGKIWWVLLFILQACGPEDDSKTAPATNSEFIFTRVPADLSNVKHSNPIIETELINFYTWKYIYNGSGVALGDINNDGLTDIYVGSNLYSAKLYLNKGNFVFEDITSSAGVLANDGYKTGVSMADINGDGLLDIYVCRDALENRELRTNLVYINNGDLTFSEKSEELGLRDYSFSTQAVFFDFDLDNDLDIYLVNHPNNFDKAIRVRLKVEDGRQIRNEEPVSPFFSDRLFRNDGGTFTDISREAGIANHAYGLSAAISDINGDSYPDIYVANDFVEPDFIYINDQKGGFREAGDDYLRHMTNSSMGSDVADIDGDGFEDFVVLDMMPDDNYRQKLMSTPMGYDRIQTLEGFGYKSQIMRNMVQLNQGVGSFSEIGQLLGVSNTDWSWGALFADLDLDGLNDLLITNGIKKDMTNLDYLTFKTDSIRKARMQDKEAVNLDNWREWVDFIPSTKINNYIFQNKGNLNFESVGKRWGLLEKSFSNGGAYADLDNDGDLDLVINNLEDTVFIYENNAKQIFNHNFLNISLKGPKGNNFGVGAEVKTFTSGKSQVKTLYPVRGFLSSVQPMLNFGFKEIANIDSLLVTWPDGNYQILRDPQINTKLTLDYKNSTPARNDMRKARPELEEKDDFNFSHKENSYEEFRVDLLIPHSSTRLGPAAAKSRVNDDKVEDIYIGGARGNSGYLMLSSLNGYEEVRFNAFKEDSLLEDTDAIFLDVDGDGDSDLFVVSGGGQLGDENCCVDRLYIWEEDQFRLGATYDLGSNSLTVSTLDVDQDGDLDLFVGGGFQPANYPYPSVSYFLENSDGELVYNEKWSETLPRHSYSESQVTDLNEDGFDDLILAGEWSPVIVMENSTTSSFSDETDKYGLTLSNGWWQSLAIADIDDDGDQDIIAGNIGLNSRYQATPLEPLSIYAGDFDKNGDNEHIITYYNQGQEWPLPRKEVLTNVVKKFRKDFVRFETYADATVDEIIDIDKAFKLKAFYTGSALLENKGGKFEISLLPPYAQMAPAMDVELYDFNEDGRLDIIGVGNRSDADVEQGPYDASNGFILLQEDSLSFRQYHPVKSGFVASKEARDLLIFENSASVSFLVINNDDRFQLFTKGRKKTLDEK